MTTRYNYYLSVQKHPDTGHYVFTQINRMRKDSDRLHSTGRKPVYHFKLVGKLCTVYICNMDATLTHDQAIRLASAFVNGETYTYDFSVGEYVRNLPLSEREPVVY